MILFIHPHPNPPPSRGREIAKILGGFPWNVHFAAKVTPELSILGQLKITAPLGGVANVWTVLADLPLMKPLPTS